MQVIDNMGNIEKFKPSRIENKLRNETNLDDDTIDLITRAVDEQRILGKAIQVLNENSQIEKEYLMGTLKENEETVSLSMINMSLEEKVRIWSLFNQPYRISAFYKVGPIFLESDKIKTFKRVQTVDISVHQK